LFVCTYTNSKKKRKKEGAKKIPDGIWFLVSFLSFNSLTLLFLHFVSFVIISALSSRRSGSFFRTEQYTNRPMCSRKW
jgi:hypothetical protein